MSFVAAALATAMVSGSPSAQTPTEQRESNTLAESSSALSDLSPAQRAEMATLLQRREYKVAERMLLKEIEGDPVSQRAGRLLSFLGRVYFLDQDYVNAAIAWGKSGKIAPLDASARFSLAMVYVRLNHPDWARPLLQNLASTNPDQPLFPYWLGRLDYDAGHYDQAISHYQHALALDPKMARAYDNLGLCFYFQNRNQLAVENFRKAIALEAQSGRPSAWPHLNLAIALQFEGKLEEAEAELRDALRLDPTLAQAQFRLGTVLASLGQTDAAEAALREASRLDPAYAEPHFALSRIYRRQGRKDLAQEEVQAYQKLQARERPESEPTVH